MAVCQLLKQIQTVNQCQKLEIFLIIRVNLTVHHTIRTNWQKLVAQHLLSLQAAGLTHLPKSSGGSTLNLRQLQSETQPEPTQSNINSATNSIATDSVNKNYLPTTPAQTESQIHEPPRPDYNTTTTPNKPSPPSIQPSIQPSTNFSESNRVPPNQRQAALDVLQNEISQCTKCDDLSKLRTQTVFGVGSPNARLVFVGEAPGGRRRPNWRALRRRSREAAR